MDVLLRTGEVVPSKASSGTAVYDFTAGGGGSDEEIRHAFVYNATDRWLIMLADTEVWVDKALAKADKTPTPAFTTATYNQWQGFTMLSSGAPVAVVNNSGIDKVHYWNGGAGDFLILTNSHKMRCCIGFMGCLYGGNVHDVSWLLNRLEWSDEGDITAWSGATSGWMDLKDEGDQIMRLGRIWGNTMLIFRDRSVYLGLATADPYFPLAVQFLSGRGVLSASSVHRLEREYMYLGDDDVYMCDATGARSVGVKVRKDLFRLADPAKLQYAWSFVDKREKDYYLVTDMLDGTRQAWIYNYEEGTWTRQDLTGYTALVTWLELA